MTARKTTISLKFQYHRFNDCWNTFRINNSREQFWYEDNAMTLHRMRGVPEGLFMATWYHNGTQLCFEFVVGVKTNQIQIFVNYHYFKLHSVSETNNCLLWCGSLSVYVAFLNDKIISRAPIRMDLLSVFSIWNRFSLLVFCC